MDGTKIIGRAPESLSLDERRRFAGAWVALEIYTPETLPLRRIEAVGASAAECIAQLQQRGLDPHQFEFMPLNGRF